MNDAIKSNISANLFSNKYFFSLFKCNAVITGTKEKIRYCLSSLKKNLI